MPPYLCYGKLYPPRLPAKRTASALVSLALLALSSLPAQEAQQDSTLRWMNEIAQRELQQRGETIRQVHTVAEAEHRKQEVRTKLMAGLGGLPDYSGPLNSRITGQIRNDSYTIEKVIYESLPGFYITANLYRPNRPAATRPCSCKLAIPKKGNPRTSDSRPIWP